MNKRENLAFGQRLRFCFLAVFFVFIWSFSPPMALSSGVAGDFHIDESGVLIDQAGRKIPLNKPFRRIISLYAAHTENLFYMGLSKEVIGVSRNCTYPEGAAEKKVFSYHDDPEKFLAARPDLVLIRPMIDRGYRRLMDRLEKSGITVVSIQPGSIQETYGYWKILGALTGKRELAEGMVRDFKSRVAAYGKLASNIETRKRVYFEAIHKKMKTFVRGSMADFVLTTAGGVNIAADGISSRGTNIAIYGLEKILSRGMEIDVFLAQYGAMNRPTVEIIKNEPGFSAIRAVKNGEIYIVDEHLVSRPTMRLLDGIDKIGSLLYPDMWGSGMAAPAEVKN